MSLGTILPVVNATLNGTCAVLLLLGRRAIIQKQVLLHRRLMLAAVMVSAVFLVSYLTRVWLTGTHVFPHPGWLKVVYLATLIPHSILAIGITPLILRLVYLGLKGRYEAHRRLACFIWPLWLYVNVTGILVYGMLYHL